MKANTYFLNKKLRQLVLFYKTHESKYMYVCYEV